jgi:hypothetical protein
LPLAKRRAKDIATVNRELRTENGEPQNLG